MLLFVLLLLLRVQMQVSESNYCIKTWLYYCHCHCHCYCYHYYLFHCFSSEFKFQCASQPFFLSPNYHLNQFKCIGASQLWKKIIILIRNHNKNSSNVCAQVNSFLPDDYLNFFTNHHPIFLPNHHFSFFYQIIILIRNQNKNQILSINDWNREREKCIPMEHRCDGRSISKDYDGDLYSYMFTSFTSTTHIPMEHRCDGRSIENKIMMVIT